MKIFQKNSVLFTIATLILWLNFSAHILSTLPLKKYIDAEFQSERFVFSRLVYDLKHGTQDQGGFMLRYLHVDDLYKSVEREDYGDFKARLEKGENQTDIYLSHYGLQDDLVFPVWKALEWIKNKKLENSKPDSRWHKRLQTLDYYYYNLVSQALVALVNALVFAFFLLWVARQFSTSQSWIVLGLMILTLPVLGFYGRSLWWMMWSWFLPMLVVLWGLYHKQEKPPGWGKSAAIGVLAGAAICIKTLMGYEYVAPAMVATMVPVAFYACLNRWHWQTWFRVSFAIGIFVLGGVIYAMFMHWQALENFGLDPLETIRSRYEMRAYGGATTTALQGEMLESTKASFFSLLLSYLASTKELAIPQLLFMAPFFIWLWKGRKTARDALSNAFIAATALGFLAGVSMLVILKGHAYVHGFDVVIWCIPLNLFLLVFYSTRIHSKI